MPRPDKDYYHLELAHVVATRGTCHRRQVGCVLVNERGQILSTGYNGPPRRWPNCRDFSKCEGADLPSGTGLEKCVAVHAEQNAILQCPDVEEIHTAYVTVSPCIHCVKLFVNTGCRAIVFSRPYAHDDESRAIAVTSGIQWIHRERF